MTGPAVDLSKNAEQIKSKILERETIIYSTIFSPDGEYLICANAFGTICVWKLASLNTKKLQTNDLVPNISFQAHKGPIYSLVFVEDTTLVSGGDDSTRLWNWKDILSALQDNVPFTKTHVHELKTTQTVYSRGALSMYAETNGLAYDPKNKTILAACGDNNGYVWDAHNMSLVSILKGHEDYLHSILSLPLSSQICSASEDGTVKTWDVRTAKEVSTIEVHKGVWVGAIGVDRTESWLVCGGGDNHLSQFHLPSSSLSWRVASSSNAIQSLSFFDNKIVCAGNESYVCHYNFSGELVKKVPTTVPSVFSVAINQNSPKNKILVAAGSSPYVNVYTPDYAHVTTSLYFKIN